MIAHSLWNAKISNQTYFHISLLSIYSSLMSICQGILKILEANEQYKENKLFLFFLNQNKCKNKELKWMPTWRTVVPGSTMTDWPSTNTSIKLLAAVAVVRTDHQKYWGENEINRVQVITAEDNGLINLHI